MIYDDAHTPEDHDLAGGGPEHGGLDDAPAGPGTASAAGSRQALVASGRLRLSSARSGLRAVRPSVWVFGAAVAVVGLGIGYGVGASTDPTKSTEYSAVAAQLSGATDAFYSEKDRADTAVSSLAEAKSAISTANAKVSELIKASADAAAAMATREAAVAARESAAAVVEQQIAATTITEGTWTVGVDIEPGSYRTSETVGSSCYWAIYASGTNHEDIIQNDVVTGGSPQVTLKAGQDFKTSRCGSWTKQ